MLLQSHKRNFIETKKSTQVVGNFSLFFSYNLLWAQIYTCNRTSCLRSKKRPKALVAFGTIIFYRKIIYIKY